jgi:hypothetical protein
MWLRPEDEIEDGELLTLFMQKTQGPRQGWSPVGSRLHDVFTTALKHNQGFHLVADSPDIATFLHQCDGKGRTIIQGMLRRLSIQLDRLRQDRASNTKFNKSQGSAYVTEKMFSDIANRYREVTTDLLGSHPESMGFASTASLENLAVVTVPPIELTDLPLLPLWYLRGEVMFELSYQLPEPRNKDYARILEGHVGDLLHLSGAAYCEVFTCDSDTKRRADPARDVLGLPPSFARGKGGLKDMFSQIITTL